MADKLKSVTLADVKMSDIISDVLNDVLYNIVSDVVLKTHREEKIARMRSAAVFVQSQKEEAEKNATGATADTYTTAGAHIDGEGRIFLNGNPMITTSEIYCDKCRLPRLLYPRSGQGSRPPDAGIEYCTREPYIIQEGCDIYGRSLEIKKMKKSKAKDKAKPEANDSESGDEESSQKDKPAATMTTSIKCPNCIRYMDYTRVASHLERCMGIAGRQSSRNAMVKMSSSNGNGTPRDSRASTPKPSNLSVNGSNNHNNGSSTKKRKDRDSDDDVDEGKATPKKAKRLMDKGKPLSTKPVNSALERVRSGGKSLPES